MNSDLYLKHDLYTKDDDKICKLTNDLGVAGYGLYWATVEALYLCETHRICRVELINNLNRRFITFKDGVPTVPAEIGEFVNYVYSDECQLFESDGGELYSKRIIDTCREHEEFLKKQEEFLKKQSEKGKKGMEARWGKKQGKNNKKITTDNNHSITTAITTANNLDKQEQTQEQYISSSDGYNKTDNQLHLYITRVDGSRWEVPDEFIATKQKLYPELDAYKVFLDIDTASATFPTKRPLMQNINGFVNRWFDNELKDAKAKALKITDRKDYSKLDKAEIEKEKAEMGDVFDEN